MNDIEYLRFVSEFCDDIGLNDWQEVARNGHLEINDKTIGLIRGTEPGESRWLSVYVDLGAIPEHSFAKVHKELLLANLATVEGAEGCFGIHPVTGNGVYHLRHTVDQSTQTLVNRLDAVLKTVVLQYQGVINRFI